MSNNIKQFEKVSFWQLLESRSVEVPIIQRDYAQGRDNKQKVRDTFLNVLHKALTEEQESVELDFVYGSEENKILQPLDGQQRLTTLFLLHWYIANKDKKTQEAKEILSKFTYETRTASREFCKKLVNGDITIKYDETISQTIKEDTIWFISSWEKDPTVSAMLTMLDAIHLKFKDTTGVWDKLVNNQNTPITFLYVKLENFGLSDDLYIKMNARGKQLTDFENFKSQFEKHIEDNKFEKEIDEEEIREGIKIPEKRFAHKIDTSWTDLFWKYRRKIEESDEDGNMKVKYEIDSKLTNFIASIAINCYAVMKSNLSKEEIEDRIKTLSDKPTEINKEDFLTEDSFKHLVDCFDTYAEVENETFHNAELVSSIPLWKNGFENNTSLFIGIITGESVTMQKRVLFYAQTAFLLNKTFNQDEFNDWMRVIRNIIENVTAHWNIEIMTRAIRFIANLMTEYKECDKDIYTVLENATISFSYSKEQVKEEVEKAKIINQLPTAKNVIHSTEDTNFCKGKIDFALYCTDYDSSEISTFSESTLEEVKSVFVKYFDDNDISNDCRRALFTIYDTRFYNYWWSWLNVVGADKRCIIEDTYDLKINFAKNDTWGFYLKELVLQLCVKTIDEIINNYLNTDIYASLPSWKQKIISTKELLNHSHSHYIAIARDESCCWLIPYKRVANNSEGKKKLKVIR